MTQDKGSLTYRKKKDFSSVRGGTEIYLGNRETTFEGECGHLQRERWVWGFLALLYRKLDERLAWAGRG